MSIKFVIDSILLLITGAIVIRFAGKKSVAKMTSLETVIILAIGTTMGHAVKENKLWQVVVVLFIYGLFLNIVQRLELKFALFERYLIGNATLVINNGEIIYNNMKKLKMTKDQLEMRLRQKGISYVSDVKIGTIELDGEFGYELMPHAKPITQSELIKMLKQTGDGNQPKPKGENIFDIVVKDNT